MTDDERQPDQDPAPLKHADAERLSGRDDEDRQEQSGDEIEDDPTRDPSQSASG